MSILEVKNLSVRYITGDFKDIGLKEYVLRKLTRNYSVTEFWVNKGINFHLDKGEMLGIIGTNGAGKSTLLKTVSGIMVPTTGIIKRQVTIAALLELGSGFDANLTVKENTYLRGAMLGYTRQFMDETYDQIIEFAELKEFEDRPFKHLSSGMKSRLAFSIASLVKPDILILDEVLSVGDGAFRKKSEEKMREIIKGGATTILVSHSLSQVRTMCDKVLWLNKGEQVEFGDDVQGICDRYAAFLSTQNALTVAANTVDLETPVLSVKNIPATGMISLSWTSVSDADTYELYRSTGKPGNYTLVYNGSTAAYEDTDAISGIMYHYIVRARAGHVTSSYSTSVTRVCDCAQPVLTAAQSSDGKPALTWNTVPGATDYQPYRSSSNPKNYALVYSGTDAAFTDSSATRDTTYHYIVRAMCSTNTAATSAYSAAVCITVN